MFSFTGWLSWDNPFKEVSLVQLNEAYILCVLMETVVPHIESLFPDQSENPGSISLLPPVELLGTHLAFRGARRQNAGFYIYHFSCFHFHEKELVAGLHLYLINTSDCRLTLEREWKWQLWSPREDMGALTGWPATFWCSVPVGGTGNSMDEKKASGYVPLLGNMVCQSIYLLVPMVCCKLSHQL